MKFLKRSKKLWEKYIYLVYDSRCSRSMVDSEKLEKKEVILRIFLNCERDKKK